MSPTAGGARLLDHHVEDVARSGITREQALAAGFRSRTAEELSGILKIKVESAGYTIPHPGTDYVRAKLDTPHVGKDGRAAKYLAPTGSENRLYVPEKSLRLLEEDPTKRVVFTEGEKKTLAVSLHTEEIAFGVSGIWSWRTKKQEDGIIADLTALVPKLEYRENLIGYDSDAREKVDIARAACAFAEWLRKTLRSKVGWAFPAPGPDGSKRGLDDLLVAEGADAVIDLLDHPIPPTDDGAAFVLRQRIARVSIDETKEFVGGPLFQELVEIIRQARYGIRKALCEEVRSSIEKVTVQDRSALASAVMERQGTFKDDSCEYEETEDGIVWLKSTMFGVSRILLTNFRARIATEILKDDGVEVTRHFEIEAVLRNRTINVTVSAPDFGSMGWVPEQLGASAILSPGPSLRDHARAAIQFLSEDIVTRTVYGHVGWRKIQDQWTFLHAEGGIGSAGAVPEIEVAVAEELSRAVLPHPPNGQALERAIRASLRIADAGPDHVTIPLLCAVYRSVLGNADVSLHIAGPTGAGKTELAALGQQHFGAGFDSRHLPGSWSSTGNAIEELAFLAKDMVLTVDDFVAAGGRHDQARLHREADRVFRGAGNRSGRRRMRSDATLRPPRPPRALVASTGEDIPKGRSLRARMGILEVGPEDVVWGVITELQEAGRAGEFAGAMSGYLSWLAARYENVQESLRQEVTELRDQLSKSGSHKRTPEALASLFVGLRWFLKFAVSSKALSPEEREEWEERAARALEIVAERQARHLELEEPAALFLRLLDAALVSGRCHVADTAGRCPESPGRWGWMRHTDDGAWLADSDRVGWIAKEGLYLNFDVAFAQVQTIGSRTGDEIAVTPQTLRKRLKEEGHLAAFDEGRLDTKRSVEGDRRRVVVLKPSLFLSEPGQPGQEGQSVVEEDEPEPGGAPKSRPGQSSGPGKPGRELGQGPGRTEPDRPPSAPSAPDAPASPEEESDRRSGGSSPDDEVEL